MNGLSELAELLRCLECRSELYEEPGRLRCAECDAVYPVTHGTIRMLRNRGDVAEQQLKRATAASFAYEWAEFGGVRPEWEKNFRDYLRPHAPEWLHGKLVLDVGTGSGRHALHAAGNGARVVAVDLGASIDIARANLPADVLTVQADAEDLPFDSGAFDLVMSIGVLHHLPDPERALRALAPVVKSGGHLHVYLYWTPERASHRAILRLVTAARRVTVRMPHSVLHLLCYPLAGILWLGIVRPYAALRGRRRGRAIADALPLKTYADYPFGVLVNDQFDRFSAPLEVRYTREEVLAMLTRVGVRQIVVLPNHGWVADGVCPGAERSVARARRD